MMDKDYDDVPLRVGTHTLASRLIVGTGRYDTMELMRDSLAAWALMW